MLDMTQFDTSEFDMNTQKSLVSIDFMKHLSHILKRTDETSDFMLAM